VAEVRKSQNLGLKAASAWSMNLGKIESKPGDFSGFKRLRTAASSPVLKGPKILFPSGAGTFHSLHSSLLVGLVDSAPPVLCASIFMSCEAMEFAETGHRRWERPDLPVGSLMAFHALLL